MPKKTVFIIIIGMCIAVAATAYAIYDRVNDYRKGGLITQNKQFSGQKEVGIYDNAYSNASRTAIVVDSRAQSNNPASQSIISTHSTQQSSQTPAKPIKTLPQASSTPVITNTNSTLSAQEKEQVRTTLNAFMVAHEQLQIATLDLNTALNMTATTTSARQNAGQLDPYIAAYEKMATDIKNLNTTAPAPIASEMKKMALYIDQATSALKDIKSDATTGQFRSGPSMAFSDASIDIAQTMVYLAEILRESAIPLTGNDPAYQLIIMSGRL